MEKGRRILWDERDPGEKLSLVMMVAFSAAVSGLGLWLTFDALLEGSIVAIMIWGSVAAFILEVSFKWSRRNAR